MKATEREYEILESLLDVTSGDFGIELTKARMDDKEQILFIISNPGEPKLILKIEKIEKDTKTEKARVTLECRPGESQAPNTTEETKDETKDIPKNSEDK